MSARNIDGRRPPRPLRIAGLSPLSSVDWPGMLVATVFLQGCPWDCFYCHNPALISPCTPGAVSWDEVLELLRRRRGLLDGVVFSGGEPTMQRGLLSAMQQVRELGFQVGLHTGGAYPTLLARVLREVDWVGLDVKADFAEYEQVTGRPASGGFAERSLELVLAAHLARRCGPHPLAYEVRTTAHPDATSDARLARLGAQLADRGVEHWAVQRFRSENARCGEPEHPPLALDELPAGRFETLAVR